MVVLLRDILLPFVAGIALADRSTHWSSGSSGLG